MISPSDAQIAEKCGYYITLRRRNVRTTSPFAAYGKAFAALVAGHTEEAKAEISRLGPGQEEDVLLLAARYLADMPRGEGAQTEWEFALRADGSRCAWDDPERITRGKVDAWWKISEPGRGVVLVLRDDKTGVSSVPHPSDNLQFGVYAKALEDEAYGARVVGEIAKPREDDPKKRLIRYEYQPGEIEALWRRFLRAEAQSTAENPLASPGGHCSDCWERQRCEARLLPAMQPSPPELAPFQFGGPPLTAERAAQALRVVQALGDLYDTAKEQLEAWAKEHGPIRDGDREWAPIDVSGRSSADVAGLEAAGLVQYIKRGKPFTQFRWRKAR